MLVVRGRKSHGLMFELSEMVFSSGNIWFSGGYLVLFLPVKESRRTTEDNGLTAMGQWCWNSGEGGGISSDSGERVDRLFWEREGKIIFFLPNLEFSASQKIL